MIADCEAHSEDACRSAVLTGNGLTAGGAGLEFVGDYETAGCHCYASGDLEGICYYSTTSAVTQSNSQLSLPLFRPAGHDCSGLSMQCSMQCRPRPMQAQGHARTARDHVMVLIVGLAHFAPLYSYLTTLSSLPSSSTCLTMCWYSSYQSLPSPHLGGHR